MTAIRRRSIRAKIPAYTVMCAADDLNGAGTTLDVSGCQRVILAVFQATLGTAGIDVVQLSHDGGVTWAADDTLMLGNANDITGDIVADAAMEAAGVDPLVAATSLFKSGPYRGPTLMRVVRDGTDAQPGTSVAWQTGAPSVNAFRIY
jgi:hypothetical protein